MSGNVRVKTLNLEGDEQSDLSVHGGVHKAVYAYPSEHYRFWREEVPGIDLPLGVFGENFTTEGLLEVRVTVSPACGADAERARSRIWLVPTPRVRLGLVKVTVARTCTLPEPAV